MYYCKERHGIWVVFLKSQDMADTHLTMAAHCTKLLLRAKKWFHNNGKTTNKHDLYRWKKVICYENY